MINYLGAIRGFRFNVAWINFKITKETVFLVASLEGHGGVRMLMK